MKLIRVSLGFRSDFSTSFLTSGYDFSFYFFIRNEIRRNPDSLELICLKNQNLESWQTSSISRKRLPVLAPGGCRLQIFKKEIGKKILDYYYNIDIVSDLRQNIFLTAPLIISRTVIDTNDDAQKWNNHRKLQNYFIYVIVL